MCRQIEQLSSRKAWLRAGCHAVCPKAAKAQVEDSATAWVEPDNYIAQPCCPFDVTDLLGRAGAAPCGQRHFV